MNEKDSIFIELGSIELDFFDALPAKMRQEIWQYLQTSYRNDAQEYGVRCGIGIHTIGSDGESRTLR